MCHIRYEELVEDPETRSCAARSTISGWSGTESLLRFHESDRVVRTPSAEQVPRPLNRNGIGTWQPYTQWLGPLREALGPPRRRLISSGNGRA